MKFLWDFDTFCSLTCIQCLFAKTITWIFQVRQDSLWSWMVANYARIKVFSLPISWSSIASLGRPYRVALRYKHGCCTCCQWWQARPFLLGSFLSIACPTFFLVPLANLGSFMPLLAASWLNSRVVFGATVLQFCSILRIDVVLFHFYLLLHHFPASTFLHSLHHSETIFANASGYICSAANPQWCSLHFSQVASSSSASNLRMLEPLPKKAFVFSFPTCPVSWRRSALLHVPSALKNNDLIAFDGNVQSKAI